MIDALVLKLLAAVTMFIDHLGLMCFPKYHILRIIGRLSMPIYAYCIAEGFRYTKSRMKYFLRIFILGALCQIVYTIVDGEIYLGILITFSMSIIIMELQECFMKSLSSEANPVSDAVQKLFHGSLTDGQQKFACGFLYALSVVCALLLTLFVTVDYGFFGIMLPVSAALFPNDRKKRIISFTVCLIFLAIYECFAGFSTQIYSIGALIPIIMYNGKKGRYSLKYFFYIFYPVHLILIYIFAIIISVLK